MHSREQEPHARRAQRQRRLAQHLFERQLVPATGDEASTLLVLDALRECFASNLPLPLLPASEQRVVRSIYFDGLTERATGVALGLAPSSIHERRIRALDKLRRCVASKGFGRW